MSQEGLSAIWGVGGQESSQFWAKRAGGPESCLRTLHSRDKHRRRPGRPFETALATFPRV